MRTGVRFPVTSDRLTIRPLVIEDARSLHELYSDPKAMRHLATELPATIAQSVSWVQEKIDRHTATGLSMWAVLLTKSREVIGDAGLQLLEDGATVEVGVRIKRRLWGNGYGTEAAKAAMAAGFRDLDLSRIIGMTAPGDDAAVAAMARIGMAPCGIERHYGRDWVVYEAKAEPTTSRAVLR
ncbi:MAG: GNAT family N-acetyltransferase [Acidimicrobiia bacterium]|nr:GNAT family N-acetyltransferase [Acidimicrobiia bacterium]